jgi:hypothetical protein
MDHIQLFYSSSENMIPAPICSAKKNFLRVTITKALNHKTIILRDAYNATHTITKK